MILDADSLGNGADAVRRFNRKWVYRGKLSDGKEMARFAAKRYFELAKLYSDEDYRKERHLYYVLDLRVRIADERFVTYQKYTSNYTGGFHEYYTEELVSFDVEGNKAIDFDYMIQPRYRAKVQRMLFEKILQDKRYRKHASDLGLEGVRECFEEYDDSLKKTGRIQMPSMGLGERGLVFSCQPYLIAPFSAGALHFVLPYEKILPYLTKRGNWCVEALLRKQTL